MGYFGRGGHLQPQPLAQPGGAAGVVYVGMGDEEGRYPLGIKPLPRDLRDDLVRRTPATGVNERIFLATVEQIDVAVVVVGQAKAHLSTPDEVQPIGNPHRALPSPGNGAYVMPPTPQRPRRLPAVAGG